MNKTIVKGILCSFIGAVVFGYLFFWQKDNGLFPNFFFSITAGILGYYFVAPLIMSEKEMEDFEEKVDKWLEDDKDIKH